MNHTALASLAALSPGERPAQPSSRPLPVSAGTTIRALPRHSSQPRLHAVDRQRFVVTSLLASMPTSTLPRDVLQGLTRTPKVLPPKHFYDEYGARLFDAICTTEEYYPTRTEAGLLERVAGEIIDRVRPHALIELGSGAARKTRILLDHLTHRVAWPWYVPVDISEAMLQSSAATLLHDYPSLRVHGVIADYDHHLHCLPDSERRLIAFLGSTIGNFRQPAAIEFLARLARGMTANDRLLLGLDLVKRPAVLYAAYNDPMGLTAEFNRNILRVINRQLAANFDPDAFEHIARYQIEQQQIEMSLRARRNQVVHIGALGLDVAFTHGERLRTEISRKFTRESASALIQAAGMTIDKWYESDDRYFALVVAAVARAGVPVSRESQPRQ